MSIPYGGDQNISGRITALKLRKSLLEEKIKEELGRPYPSYDLLTSLKLTKLRVKEEIETSQEAA